MHVWRKWNILYGIYIAYKDWPWDHTRKILVDKEGKTFYYDEEKKECVIIDNTWAESLVEEWRIIENWEEQTVER